MSNELKQILIGIVFFIILIFFALHFSGNKNDLDLTSPDNQGNYLGM